MLVASSLWKLQLPNDFLIAVYDYEIVGPAVGWKRIRNEHVA